MTETHCHLSVMGKGDSSVLPACQPLRGHFSAPSGLSAEVPAYPGSEFVGSVES